MASTDDVAGGRPGPVAPDSPELIVVDSHRIACDGGGALGHPKIWMELGGDDFVDCGYCDRRFVRRGSPLDPAAG